MASAHHASEALVGQAFDCDFGAFVPRLTFGPGRDLRIQAKLGDIDIDQVVKAEIEDLRPEVFLVSWVEDNGNFIVQVQDHANRIVHNHARLADGQVFRAEGMLRRVPAG
ncbi:MoaF-related domain-containing protein [Mesorhizobium marinum]|uniref:MoaF-like domain-containing protein n=1 Tax=Mesorhizobium marinum TaxID=3228790 RepID=A0ABV3QTK7_9HYPH